MESSNIKVPRYYQPWPHQQAAWQRRQSGEFTYYIKLWARQLGKDADDIQWNNNYAWKHPGVQLAYIGLDNVWINNNIFKKYIDGRTFWQDYPNEYIDPKDTQKEVLFKNNPDGYAPSRIKFIGFLNDQGLIGSSYDGFTISEASLYADQAFRYIRPIWDRKLAMGKPLQVNLNGTPRGMHNVFYELLRTYTGEDEPEKFPGAHGNCYVDKVRIQDAMIPDGNGGWKRLYSDEDVEKLKSQYLREFGDLNFYYQENECDFTVVNSGLVYKAIEQLEKEGRYTNVNIDVTKPVYLAWDISSKAKITDATACIVFQYYNNHFMILDWFEERSKSLVECVSELSQRDYWRYVRFAALPWDSDRSASSETPIEECRRLFPSITWHALSKERVDRGIQLVREMLPNMIINKQKCEWVMECFQHYEYKRLLKEDDWAAKPRHDRHSHIMDAIRYAVMAVKEIDYLQLNADGQSTLKAGRYGYFDEEDEQPWLPTIYGPKPKRRDSGLYYY